LSEAKGIGINMKKILIIMNVLFLCFVFSACGKKEIEDGSSHEFSDAEIASAENAIIEEFKNWEGCELIKLYYDEEKSNIEVEDYMVSGKGAVVKVEKSNIIVFFSDFNAGNCGDIGLTPNTTYTDWTWILIRDSETSEWKVDEWGY